MVTLNALINSIFDAFLRAVTGRLFSDQQIQAITSNTVGKYFTDWFPTPEKELETRERVEQAREHISKASAIIGGMQSDLENHTRQLDQILKEVKEKKQLAERYAELAQTNEEKLAAFKAEMEESLRRELMAQAGQGKRLRQLASFVVWLLTLIIGAVLGAYFKEILTWVGSLFA